MIIGYFFVAILLAINHQLVSSFGNISPIEKSAMPLNSPPDDKEITWNDDNEGIDEMTIIKQIDCNKLLLDERLTRADIRAILVRSIELLDGHTTSSRPTNRKLDERAARLVEGLIGEPLEPSNQLISNQPASSRDDPPRALPVSVLSPPQVANAAISLPPQSHQSHLSSKPRQAASPRPQTGAGHIMLISGSEFAAGAMDDSSGVLMPALSPQRSPGEQLKPAVGRWSDWYDMSVEPDLAASESQPAAAAAAAAAPLLSYRNLYAGSSLPQQQPPQTLPVSRWPPLTRQANGVAQIHGVKGAGLAGRSAMAQPQTHLPVLQQPASSQQATASFTASNPIRQPQQLIGQPAKQLELGQEAALGRPQNQHHRHNQPNQHKVIGQEVRVQRLVASSQRQQPELLMPLRQQQHPAQVNAKHQVGAPLVRRLGAVQENGELAAKRREQAKRRRLRTQVPVGLSSWILGGIRDLDGRHWQLPSEVIARLAINDVDFPGSSSQSVQPPAAGSVVLIGGVPGGQPNHTEMGRVPITQLVPR